MPFQINLNNPLIFTPVTVPMPLDAEISEHLYHHKIRITQFSTTKEKKKFIAQWKALVDCLAQIMLQEINRDLYYVHPVFLQAVERQYPHIAERLKRGISASILHVGDGLLPHQNNAVFYDLKSFLESICFYYFQYPDTRRDLLDNLYQKLEMCGPGLFSHIQQTFYELYHPADHLFYWLADFRETILTALMEKHCETYQVTDLYRAHVYTAFSQRAKENQWHLLQENQHFSDMLMGMAIDPRFSADIYTNFEKEFRKKYTTETVSYLAERLKIFIIDQFKENAVNNTVSSNHLEKFNSFYKETTAVLDSFGLSLSYFLRVMREDNPVQYKLNKKALTQMEIYVAIGLHGFGLLDTKPLYLLGAISENYSDDNGMFELGKKLVDEVAPEVWLHEFRLAFNANPPDDYRFDKRRRTEGSQLFRTVPAFNSLLRKLGLLNSPDISSADKLALILNSHDFTVFLWDQLEITVGLLYSFREKYPLPSQQGSESTLMVSA